MRNEIILLNPSSVCAIAAAPVQIQEFEVEVDRLYKLNELRSVCNRILPIKSLREKENEKIKPDKSQGMNRSIGVVEENGTSQR
ncbi:hypothetical protein LXL04_017673 [Taraxacum kok-saghyz]